MSTLAHQATAVRELARHAELKRCRGDLWYLLTEYMDYGFNAKIRPLPRGLTEEWHRPVCEWLDWHRDTPKLALWCKRGWHKTTIEIGLSVQEWLREPLRAHRIWTGGPDLVSDLVSDMHRQIRDNDRLRGLDPIGVDPRTGKPFRAFPNKNKKFTSYQQGAGSVDMYRPFGAKSRGKTFRIATAATESTGGHVDGFGGLDDIIVRNTVERSGLQGISDWFTSTALNVVDSGRFRSFATPWSDNSIHQEWMRDDDWVTLVLPGAISESHGDFIEMVGDRAAKKLHFTACYKFSNPTFWPADWDGKARKKLRNDEHHMKGNFSPQIMCDPEPAAEKPWGKDCENFTSIQPGAGMPGVLGRGAVFVLSDPAPWLTGSFQGITEKQRGDGSKDYWSICVVKLRPRGSVLDIILLDGMRSQEWGPRDGCNQAAQFMAHFRTSLFFSEHANIYWDHMREAVVLHGAKLRRAKDGGPQKFADYNKSDGKNFRFAALAEKAKDGEFWISEGCSQDYLYGDKEHTGFLTQARKWRKVAQGKNSLRFDDDADCVSRATDPALLQFAPSPSSMAVDPEAYSPYRSNKNEDEPGFATRYIRC